MTKNKIDKSNPIVVADTEWAKSVSDWVYKEVQAERMINGMCEILGKKKLDYKDSVGDAECCVWLMTASNKAPLDSDATDIFVYLTAKLMLKTKRIKSEDALPDFCRETYKKGLTDYQKTRLDDLKYEIYKSRGRKIKHPILSFLKEFQKEFKDKPKVKRK